MFDLMIVLPVDVETLATAFLPVFVPQGHEELNTELTYRYYIPVSSVLRN